MPEAELQGETHLSKKDRQTLLQLDLSRFDAVFREGNNSEYHGRKPTIGYTLFEIGSLLYRGTYGRLYHSPGEFEQKVIDSDVPFEKIDAELHDIYDMIPRRKRAILLLISPLYTGFVLAIFAGIVSGGLGFLGVVVPQWVSLIMAFCFLLFYGLLWPLGFFILSVDETMDDRDEHMAENVLSYSEDQNFEKVLVSVGDGHRRGITSILEAEGWEVDPKPTESWIGKILLWIDRLTWAILNPRKILQRVISVIK